MIITHKGLSLFLITAYHQNVPAWGWVLENRTKPYTPTEYQSCWWWWWLSKNQIPNFDLFSNTQTHSHSRVLNVSIRGGEWRVSKKQSTRPTRGGTGDVGCHKWGSDGYQKNKTPAQHEGEHTYYQWHQVLQMGKWRVLKQSNTRLHAGEYSTTATFCACKCGSDGDQNNQIPTGHTRNIPPMANWAVGVEVTGIKQNQIPASHMRNIPRMANWAAVDVEVTGINHNQIPAPAPPHAGNMHTKGVMTFLCLQKCMCEGRWVWKWSKQRFG
jgi:hypothetical protein